MRVYVQFVDFKKENKSYGAIKIYKEKEVPEGTKLSWHYCNDKSIKEYILKNLKKGDLVDIITNKNENGYYVIQEIKKILNGQEGVKPYNGQFAEAKFIDDSKSKLLNTIIMSIAPLLDQVDTNSIGDILIAQVSHTFKNLNRLLSEEDSKETKKVESKKKYSPPVKEENLEENLEDYEEITKDDDIPF